MRLLPAILAGMMCVLTVSLKETVSTLRGVPAAGASLSSDWLCKITSMLLGSALLLVRELGSVGIVLVGVLEIADSIVVVAWQGVGCDLYCVPMVIPSFVSTVSVAGIVLWMQSIVVLSAVACCVSKGINGVLPVGFVRAFLMLDSAAMMTSTDDVVGIGTFVGNHAIVSHMRLHCVARIQTQ